MVAAPAPLATTLLEWLAGVAVPWQDAYADSAVLPSAVRFAHFAGLLVGGGLALAADRATLQAWRADAAARARQLQALAATHRLVVGALALLVASGALLLLADVEAIATSPVFWTKATLVLLLLANGFAMTRAEGALHTAADDPAASERLWRRLRGHAAASVALWLLTVLAGAVLTSA